MRSIIMAFREEIRFFILLCNKKEIMRNVTPDERVTYVQMQISPNTFMFQLANVPNRRLPASPAASSNGKAKISHAVVRSNRGQ